MSHDTHDLSKAKVGYLIVGGALLIGTVITVAVSYLHLPVHLAIIVALTVATIKASLVCCYFMHLISEQKLIYLILIFAVLCFFAMLLLPIAEFHNVYDGSKYVS